jgi:hypothetical protein
MGIKALRLGRTVKIREELRFEKKKKKNSIFSEIYH